MDHIKRLKIYFFLMWNEKFCISYFRPSHTINNVITQQQILAKNKSRSHITKNPWTIEQVEWKELYIPIYTSLELDYVDVSLVDNVHY